MSLLGRKLVRVQERGQVRIPTRVRRRLGIKQGDLVEVIETADGVLITPREVVAAKALDRIGEALRETGLSLDDLIESGREERGTTQREATEDRSPRNRGAQPHGGYPVAPLETAGAQLSP